jgi:HK97 family phage major capsid protein
MKKTVIELKRALETAQKDLKVLSRSIDAKSATEEQMEDMKGMELQVETLERQLKIEERSEKAELEAAAQSFQEEKVLSPEQQATKDEALQRKVFKTYLRSGSLESLTAEETKEYRGAIQRGQVIGVDGRGGFSTPEYFSSKLIESLKDSTGAMELVDLLVTSDGNPINFTEQSDIANIAVPIAEATAAAEDELTFKRITIGAKKFTSKLFRVSSELITDSIIDIEAHIAKIIRQRFSRAINQYATKGLGTADEPRGFALLPSTFQTQTMAVATAVAYDELVDLQSKLDPAYFKNGNVHWTFSQLTEAALMKIKDTTGQPIWSRGDITKKAPSTLLGIPIVINNDMSSIGTANSTIIAIGDFKAAYMFRLVNGVAIKKSDDRYMESDEVGFVAFARMDGNIMDTEALKLLVSPV